MGRWIGVGTAMQVAMVLAGHWIPAVASLFGLLGVTISLGVGMLWARHAAESYGAAAGGGAVVGGVCALVGILVSVLLGDVGAVLLVAGTLSSAVTGALGGMLGHRLPSAAAGTGP